MLNGAMDPELMRLAQEQMSRISPAEFARMQQQMMSNPDLMRMASESMKNMKPEDLKYAAEQFKQTRPEEMAEIGEKMANSSPEEIAAMRSRIDAQVNYELEAAQLLKKQGNELHSQGRFNDASEKYFLAKENLKGIPTSKGRTLQLACSLNLMSCYLKTGRNGDCINEGNEVLEYDENNVKGLYRRGQAYKELGQLEEAVSDLSKAHEISPDDETIAEVLRDARGQLDKEGGQHSSKKTEDAEYVSSSNPSLSVEHSDYQPQGTNDTLNLQSKVYGAVPTTDFEGLQTLKDDPEAIRSLQNFISNADPDSVVALEGGKEASPDMLRSASTIISKMSPDELQRMVQLASSFEEQNPPTGDSSDTNMNDGPITPTITPEMLQTATDMLSKMPSEETSEMVSSLEGQSSVSSRNYEPVFVRSSMSESNIAGETISSPYRESPSSAVELHEQIRNQMRDPAMREMFTSMIKNMDPEMMADMSEQFGIKLSREDAIQAQQAMSTMSPERLDRMMSWADKVQKGVDGVKKAKTHLLGRTGLILAICIVILAMVLHRLGERSEMQQNVVIEKLEISEKKRVLRCGVESNQIV